MRKSLRSLLPGLLALSLMALPWLAGYAQSQTIPLSPSGTLQNNTSSATSNGTALTILGQIPVLSIQSSGTFSGATFTIQGSLDNVNYNTITCYSNDGGTTFNTAGWLSTAGMFRCDTAGYNYVQAAINAGTPGGVTIKAQGVIPSHGISAAKPGVPGTMTTLSLTTGITDGNGNTALTIASTAAGAVNDVGVAAAATGVNPQIQCVGTDTNVGCTIVPKGSGNTRVSSSGASGGAHLEFRANASPTILAGVLGVGSTDVTGNITAAVGNVMTLTFAQAWAVRAPFCTVSNQTHASGVIFTPGTASITFVSLNSFTTSDVLNYTCVGTF